jgi:hypothetical protein
LASSLSSLSLVLSWSGVGSWIIGKDAGSGERSLRQTRGKPGAAVNQKAAFEGGFL